MTKEQKDFIDKATYEQLLRRWRYGKIGESLFQGEAGKYFQKVMGERRDEVGETAHVRASKAIGWR